MIFAGRRIGVFLFVMAGVALVDWGLAAAIFRGPPAIVDLILYGELYNDSHPPLPSGLMFLPCPGNGLAFFCGPLLLSLIFLFTLAVGIGLYVKCDENAGLGGCPGLGWSPGPSAALYQSFHRCLGIARLRVCLGLGPVLWNLRTPALGHTHLPCGGAIHTPFVCLGQPCRGPSPSPEPPNRLGLSSKPVRHAHFTLSLSKGVPGGQTDS